MSKGTKGYWFVAVQDVLKPDVWKSCLPAWEQYVASSNGACNPIYFGPPAATFEAGISKTMAIVEFPSLEQALNVRAEDAEYNPGMIEADGTPVENKVIRDFRITDVSSGWMKPGHGYWIVWIREIKDKESLAKVMPVWEEYVESGACVVHHLRPPQAVYEDGRMLPLAVCEFPSLQAALDARNSKEYVQGVIGAAGKPVEEIATRDFRIIEGPDTN